MQTFFIAAGSVIASVLPWLLAQIGVSNVAAAGVIPDTVKFAFYAGAVALLGAMGWTIVSTREYPPDALAAFDDAARAPTTSLAMTRVRTIGWLWVMAGLSSALAVHLLGVDRQLYVLATGMLAFGLVQLVVSVSHSNSLLVQITTDVFTMPRTMRQLAPVQFFSWFALFAMWIYTTAAVTHVHFGAQDTRSPEYNDGANWVGVLFAAYNGFAIVAAILIPWMTRRLGLRVSHLINLALGGLGMISFLVIEDARWLLLSMVGVGFAWASMLSLPYVLLSDSVPPKKMGVYMGIFNIFIVIPQLLAAGTLGFLLKTFFANAPINALLIGGASLLVAGLLVLRVDARDE
jgi:maltose/moltooligosaccharide transporter